MVPSAAAEGHEHLDSKRERELNCIEEITGLCEEEDEQPNQREREPFRPIMEGMEIKNVIAIIVLSLIVAAAGKTARNEATPYQRFCTNANCPTYEHSSSIVANGDDCDSFCICTCDGALYMKCPEGLQYDDRTKSCDWPSVVGCGSTTQSHGPTTTPRPQGSCEKVKPQCPANNGVNATLLPNPDDCGSYCVCDWGNAIWMPCPAGLEFNPTLHVCDWPALAGCGSSGGSTTRKPGSTTRIPPTPPHGHNGCDKVESKCPAENSGNAILMPNPDDCGSYCVCDWGNAILMPCPPGLEFNPKLMVCDWPANAGCSSNPPKTTTNDNVTPTNPPPTPGNNGCAKVKPKCPAENSGNAILLPNPDDCGSYCVCDWGNAIYMSCPAGLEFNPTLMVCDWPANAGCSSNPPKTTTNDNVTPTNPPPTPGNNGCAKVQPKCPAENSGNAILLPNPDDCGSYCVCDWGNAIYMSCPAGLEFNPTLMVCDWPANAGCSSNPPKTTTNDNVTPTNPQPTPGNNGCAKVQPKCPAENSGNAILLPNPDDCGSYCVCDWGNAIYMSCPAGLEFNPTLMVCDWPANAGCSSNPPKTTTNDNVTPTKPQPTPGNNGCAKVQPKCPAENSGNAILLPNPDDCGSYCVCDWGNAIYMSCPAGLEFNPTLMVCDWPANAGCSSNPPKTTTNDNVTPTNPQPTPGNNGCAKVRPKCPAENSGNAILLPNPDDCGSYCVCDWGNAIYMSCPAGLEFNPTLMVCDWPANAGCSSNPPKTTTNDNVTPTKPQPTPGNNGCAKVQPKCPAENSGNAILLPNPDDCGSYCVCDWGNAIYMSCPAGLEFNPKVMVCDWPANAGCSSNPPKTTTNDNVTPTNPQPTPGNNGCAKVRPKCPAENSGNAILLPNPDDCGSYCVCNWGNAIYMSCPAGLEFNPTLMVCDWPANAGCSSNPPKTTTSDNVTPTNPPPTPGNNGCAKVQPKCPAENSGNAILLPNPDDCGSYCVCNWGNAIYMSCPAGLEFNAKLMVCDWPANAGCSSDPVPPPTSGPKPTIKPGNNGCSKVQPKCPAENSGNAILLPNPDDCGSYCVCDWGNAIYMSCPAGLEFNAKLMVCDWPANAGCSSDPVPPPTSGPKPTIKPGNNGCSKVQPKCPAENSGNAILLPNPDDCGSYCVCDWGNAIYMSCPAGLEFNAKLMVCDWPANAGCSSDPVPPPTSGPKPTIKPGNNGCSKVQPKCPAENSGNAILLPNPDDCGSYCVCDWGNAIYMSCPSGLEFNAKLMVCDWPANAGCSSDPVPPPTSGPVDPNRPTSAPVNNGCAKVQPKCPAENSGNAILLPNPDDCGSYCVCDWGNAIYMSCPAGTEFNPKLMVCDWPANAGCSSDPVNPPPSSSVCVDITCPPTNGVNATLLPNPHDCSSYCVCDYGRPFVMPCPSGLEFNPNLKVCDWPKNAGCTIAP